MRDTGVNQGETWFFTEFRYFFTYLAIHMAAGAKALDSSLYRRHD
jgi:hypothetical protein